MASVTDIPIEEINDTIAAQILAGTQANDAEKEKPSAEADVIPSSEAEKEGTPIAAPAEEKGTDPDSGKNSNPNSVNPKSVDVPVEEEIDDLVFGVKEIPGGDNAGVVDEKAKEVAGVESSDSLDHEIAKIESMRKWKEIKKRKSYVLVDSPEETESIELSSRTPTGKKKVTSSKKRLQPSRSGKKQKIEEIEAKPRIILEEYGIDEKFLKENQLGEVFDWLDYQGWTSLFKEDEQVDKELVAEFYKKVSKEEKGPVVYLNFNFKGQELTVSSRDLAYDLGLKHEGFDTFTKKSWPESITDETKEEMQMRVCNYADANNSDMSTLQMDPMIKVLHRYLVTSLMPRGSKPALVQIQDILVLDQLIRKQKVNLPKLIIHQMEYISQFNSVGYARIVKKILEVQGVYHPNKEESVVKPLTMHAIHRWGIQFDDKLGWIKKHSPVNEVPVQKHTEEKGEGSSSTVLDRLDKIDSEVAEVKGLLVNLKTLVEELKADVGKMSTSQWMIDDEISGIKGLIKAGFAGRS